MDSTVAIIDLGGKQHLVSQGARVVVNRLDSKEGEEMNLPDMLSDRTVATRVISHSLGKKVNGLKFKAKTRSFKRYGHRQRETVVEVISIQSSKTQLKNEVAQSVEKQPTMVKKTVTSTDLPSKTVLKETKKVVNAKA